MHPTRPRPARIQPALLLLAVLLLAFALRLALLGGTNVWWDEAYSVWLARQPLPAIVATTAADVHPPLYYILLWAVMRFCGDGEFAARYLSAIAGLLTVAALYPLGRRLAGRRVALLAMLWLTLARFHIWWSQEARMYILAAGWVTVALYLLARQVRPSGAQRLHDAPRPRLIEWLVYTLVTVAGLYTLYLSVLVAAAGGLAILSLWAARRIPWRTVIAWGISQALALLLYLPWVIYALPQVRSQSAGAQFTPAMIMQLYMLLLSSGISTEITNHLLLIVGYALLLLGALVILARGRCWESLALLVPPLVLPPLLIYTLMIMPWRFYAPAPEARYFLLFAPVLALLPAIAVTALRRRQRLADGALLAALCCVAVGVWPGYYAGRHLRDQWKSAVQLIAAYARPGDAVALVSGDRYPLFFYEYEKVTGLPPVWLVPDGVPQLTPETVEAQMARVAQAAERIWLVEIETGVQDPDGLARAWMEAHFRPAWSTPFGYNRVTLYSADGQPPLLVEGQVQGIPAGPGLWATTAVRAFRPGDTLDVGLYATSDAGAPSCVTLVHAEGLRLKSVCAAPYSGPVRHDLLFPITQATPRGRYRLLVGEREAGAVEVTHSDPLWRKAPHPTSVALGAALELAGYAIQPEQPRPGATVMVDVYWRATAPVTQSYTVFVQIVGPYNSDTGNPLWGQHDGPPVDATFLTQEWPVGMLVRDAHGVDFALNAPPAEYQVLVGMYDPQTGARLLIPGQPDNALMLHRFSIK